MAQTASRVVAVTRRLLQSADEVETDRELLARFAHNRDEQAFAALVERHGPLVYATCQRLLPDASTADDVFQATFLVLARKSGDSYWRASIGPWLHAVAVRLARKARSHRRVAALDKDVAAPVADPAAPLAWAEVKGALDEELARLPAKLSEPLVLCYLQGRTRDEAANLLDVSLAMLKRRLERGRNVLRSRLSRRGITLAAAGWGIALSKPLAGEARARALQMASAGSPIPTRLSQMAAGVRTRAVAPWLIASTILTVGLGIGMLALAMRLGEPVHAPPKHGNRPGTPAQLEAGLDPLPAGAVLRFGSTRLTDFTIAKSATFSPDGKLFATSGQNSPLCVWNASTGKLVRKHANLGSVFDLRWRDDGVLAAVTFFNHDVFLMQGFGDWKDIDNNDARLADEHRGAQDGSKRARMEQVFLSGDGKWAFSITVSSDGKTRRLNRFKFIPNKSSATATPEESIPIPFGYGVWPSHDGRTALVCENSVDARPNRLLAYDLTAAMPETPVWIRVLPADQGHRPEACLTLDGKRAIILFWNDTVEVWDGPAGKLIRELPKLTKYYHDGNRETRGMDLTLDGKRLAMIYRGAGHEVGGRVVDVETGKDVCTLAPLPLPRFGGVARFSADGTRVAQVAYGVARIWNAETGANAIPTPGHAGSVTSLVALADGKTVVSAGSDLTVRAWDASTGRQAWRTTFPQTVAVCLATPAGVVVQESLFGADGPGSLLNAKTGKRGPLPGALATAVTTPKIAEMGRAAADAILALSPDGKSIVTLALHTSSFRVWSWPEGALKATVPITPPDKLTVSQCSRACFTPDGKQFVAVMQYEKNNQLDFDRPGRAPAFIERWDLSAGKMLNRASDGTTNLSTAKLIPSADGIMVLGNGPELRDAITGKTVVKLACPDGQAADFQWASVAALSPDGRTLAIGDSWSNKVWLFELRTGRKRQLLSPEGRYRNALRFLPDGRLVTASDAAIVWRISLQPAADATEEIAKLWERLAVGDPTIAYPAMAGLAGRGGAVEFITARVPVVPRIKPNTIAGIVKRLDAAGFNEREAASAELEKLGAAAVPAVKASLKAVVSEEAHTRIERFLGKFDRTEMPSEELRALRALEVLEAIGNADAKKALELYAAGEPGARITRDAATAMRRLGRPLQ